MNSNYFNSFSEAVQASFQDVWFRFVDIVPKLVAAILVFLIGWAIAAAIGKLVRRLVARTNVDNMIDKTGVERSLNTGNVSIAGIAGWVVKWFILVVVLLVVADILDLPQITLFLNQVVSYLPNVIVAVVILAVGFMLAKGIEGILERLMGSAGMDARQKDLLGNVSRYAIIIFTVMAALVQLGIADGLVTILFAGLVLTLALAFGLGGKEHASRWIERMQSKAR